MLAGKNLTQRPGLLRTSVTAKQLYRNLHSNSSDIDECHVASEADDPCGTPEDNHTSCLNIPGGFVCPCRRGYEFNEASGRCEGNVHIVTHSITVQNQLNCMEAPTPDMIAFQKNKIKMKEPITLESMSKLQPWIPSVASGHFWTSHMETVRVVASQMDATYHVLVDLLKWHFIFEPIKMSACPTSFAILALISLASQGKSNFKNTLLNTK